MRNLAAAFLVCFLLTACQSLYSPEEQYCLAHEESAEYWNKKDLNEFVSLLKGQNVKQVADMKAKGFSQPKIRKLLLTAQYKILQQCQSKMYHQSNPIDMPASKRFADRIYKEYINSERETFQRRTGGKSFCRTDLTAFTSNLYGQPEKNCVYPYFGSKLVILDSSNLGVLVTGPFVSMPEAGANPIFIYSNRTDSAQADNTPLVQGIFAYTGIYHYQSLLGVRSVNSFRRMNSEVLKDLWFLD